jgi:putative Holliday junction resolvase
VRYLCIDLGDKRTGLAVGDAITGVVSPAGVLEVPIASAGGAELQRALLKAIDQHGPGALVLGLPLNMDGTQGPRAKLVRAWGTRIELASRLTVSYQDERLTSADADWQMARTGLTRGQKKAKRDALAAAAILRDFLASMGHSPATPTDPTRHETGGPA